MKQTLIFIIIFISLYGNSFAQKLNYKGYVVTNAGDTMRGRIDMKFATNLNYHVVNLIDPKGYVTKYNVWQIKMYSMNNEFYYTKTAERGATEHRNNLVLMHLVKDGKVKLYEYEYVRLIGGSGKVDDGFNSGGEKDYYLERAGEDLKLLTKLNYLKTLREWLKDSPEALSDIDAKDFEYTSIPNLIDKYDKQ